MILVTGIGGLIGTALARTLVEGRRPFVGLGRGARRQGSSEYHYEPVDLEDTRSLAVALENFNPQIVIHTAAMTAVDLCEAERGQAWRVNVEATRVIAEFCVARGRRLVYISTDYVFDGRQGNYHEDSPIRPLGVYAQTKAAGELCVQSLCPGAVIARTAVPFDNVPHASKDFVRWLVGELSAGRPVSIVTDQISSPTFVRDLAAMVLTLAESDRAGIIHTAGATALSRYDFACLVAKIFSLDVSLISPIKTSELKQAAPRPLNASLNVSKAVEWGLGPQTLESTLERLRSQYLK